MSGITLKLEFSPDPLSDATPSWVDVSRYVLAADWEIGKQRDLDDIAAGQATFRLRNDDRRFEPEYAAGAYYPNIVPTRQFRLTMTADGTPYPHGRWFATSWDVTYPGGTAYSEVVVSCTDALGLLSLFLLGPMDPPDAAGLPDVIAYDQPFAYYRMNDEGGSTLKGSKARKHHHHQARKHRRQRHTPRVLTADGFGPDGVYISGSAPPDFEQPGLVVGDLDTSVQFRDAAGCYAQIPLINTGQFADTNAFTVECLFNGSGVAGNNELLEGPWISGPALHSFSLDCTVGTIASINVEFLDGTSGFVDGVTPITSLTTFHICGRWDGTTLSLYVNGALDASTTKYAGKKLRTGTVNDFLCIGGSSHTAHNANGRIDEVAFWEVALPPARIKAHADAALVLGYPQQAEGARVSALLAAAGTTQWNATTNVDAGSFQLAPVPHVGQSVLEELVHTVHCAQPWALCWFGGDGNPRYLAWDYLATGSRSTPVAVFGDSGGEVPYNGLVPIYDDEIYNQVTTTRDGGTIQTASDAASQSAYLERGYDDSGLALALDSDAAKVAGVIRDGWAQPQYRIGAITLRGVRNPLVYNQTLARDLGDLIEVRRRGGSGAPLDFLTRILGRSHSFTPDGVFDTTWSLARGWNASAGVWRLGLTGFSELNTTDALA